MGWLVLVSGPQFVGSCISVLSRVIFVMASEPLRWDYLYRYAILLFMVAPLLSVLTVEMHHLPSLLPGSKQKDYLKQTSIPLLTTDPNNFLTFDSKFKATLKTHDERAFMLYCKSGEGSFSYSEAEAGLTLEINAEGEEGDEGEEGMASPSSATARMKTPQAERELYHAFNRLFLYLTWATEDSCPHVNTELYRLFSVDSLDEPNNGPGAAQYIRIEMGSADRISQFTTRFDLFKLKQGDDSAKNFGKMLQQKASRLTTKIQPIDLMMIFLIGISSQAQLQTHILLNHEKFSGEDDAAFEGMIKFCGEFEKSTDFLQDQGSTLTANATDVKGVTERVCEYCGKVGHLFDSCHSLAHPSQYPIYLKGEGKEDKVKA